MTTSKGIIAVFVAIAAITTGSFLTGTGVAHDAKPRAKIDKVQAMLAEHEKRIVALEALLEVDTPASSEGGTTPVASTTTSPPAHIDPEPSTATPTTTSAPASSTPATTTPPTSTTPPTTTAAPRPAPTSGACSYPTGDPPGASQIGDQRLTAGQTLENFILHSDGNHAILPANVEGVTVRNGSIYANGADNIKLGNNSVYENLYLRMASNGGHLDGMQGQGATGVTIRNVTIEMIPGGPATGAILFKNQRGGNQAPTANVTFTMDCVRVINSGPWGHDIRVGADNGGSQTGRITNTILDGGVIKIVNRGGSCRFEIDAVSMPFVDNNGCEIIPI